MTDQPTNLPNEQDDVQRVVHLLQSLHDLDDEIRDRSMLELGSIDREWVIDVLTGFLHGSDSEMRSDAAEALARIDPIRSVDLLLPLLHDEDPSMRWYVCGLLHDLEDKRTLPPLIGVLLEDPEADIRLMAATALGRFGDYSALPALERAKSDEGEDYAGHRVSEAAAEAMEKILTRF